MKTLKILLLLLIFFNTAHANESFKLKKIIALSNPWGLSFINDEEIIISEKEGEILLVNIKDGSKKNIKHQCLFFFWNKF